MISTFPETEQGNAWRTHQQMLPASFHDSPHNIQHPVSPLVNTHTYTHNDYTLNEAGSTIAPAAAAYSKRTCTKLKKHRYSIPPFQPQMNLFSTVYSRFPAKRGPSSFPTLQIVAWSSEWCGCFAATWTILKTAWNGIIRHQPSEVGRCQLVGRYLWPCII